MKLFIGSFISHSSSLSSERIASSHAALRPGNADVLVGSSSDGAARKNADGDVGVPKPSGRE
jgi:hypothetical protein